MSAVLAVVVSAVLWALGTGMHPWPGAVALAPLPVLLLAPRVSARLCFAAGFLSWYGGALPYLPYFLGTVEQPPSSAYGLLTGTATVYAGLVVSTRALIRRGRLGAAMLALPSGWVLMEYLISLGGPFGAWWSLAYTQSDVLPLIQIAALTGWLGISFLIMLVPATLAVLLTSTTPLRARMRCAAAGLTVLIAVFGYGFRQLSTPSGATVPVGLVAVSQPEDYVPVDSPDGRDMITRVAAEVERLADRGAQVVVLPEKSWRATESSLPALSGPLTEVATRRHVHIIAGTLLTRGDATVNAAIDYPSGVIYEKHYLVPGLEDDLRPGHTWTQVPGTSWALAICFDLDRPALVRANRARGATLLLVPALDFREDRWLHSRMAVLRGVESGIGTARAPQLGQLVAGDANGRILATADTDITRTRSVLAAIPQPTGETLYARFGDWFAATAALLFACALAALLIRRPIRIEPGRGIMRPGVEQLPPL
ncbi:nitrilase-related carbon-nitrogen hydrolase [Nocardia seriolae]|uniref:nitrilase-related carbon-nitrogen hydrolase n=1 Tax=Nocardia seriolae TaxID=37332 RepID=UPI00068E9179|nr:nitrilase-related carbon-nitrogen hydrolase [Nocardia seriolae]MTJ61078.1 carbon-nitrogen hydrolase family protein [Nocardia seriolae]MTJ70461.1 carbon-nitrogen hydrolase family protein [Nocardia seriolae]MTJ90790.1 carbon-nitrogen hydrolase family protein [Nocardia seriolae]MTK34748.1 carbon-nitrogen hydrolase family protein [Nocardia seriolae]MTK39057.1 carbon-nitrogen hydrolase family protein [Nocardia seriolae]